MKFFILIFLLSFNKSYCQLQVVQVPVDETNYSISNQRQNNKNQNSKDSLKRDVSRLAWNILNQEKWDFAFTSAQVREWYISKKIISKTDDKIKIKILTYFPEYEIKKTIYLDVLLEQTMLFDCKNRMYKIIDGTYYRDFEKVVDIYDNPKGEMKAIIPKTIFSGLLELACDKLKK